MTEPLVPDDRPLWDALLGLLVAPSLLVAHDKGVFGLLSNGARTAAEISENTGLAPRPMEAILAVLTSSKLVAALPEGRFELTPLARSYLLPTSPTYFGGFLALVTGAFPVYSYESLKQVAVSDAPNAAGDAGLDVFDVNSAHAQMAAGFTRAMHGMSVAPAQVWPNVVDLQNAKTLVDIGGGSGVHSIAALTRWPGLKGVILDMASVCDVAREFVANAKLEGRLAVQAGDMFKGPLPAGDVHFYGSVFHDWPAARCEALAQRSFDALPKGGRILLHEMLLNDTKSGPVAVAAFSVSMLFGTRGQQFTALELSQILKKAGFTEISVKPTFGYWSVVSGMKP